MNNRNVLIAILILAIAGVLASCKSSHKPQTKSIAPTPVAAAPTKAKDNTPAPAKVTLPEPISATSGLLPIFNINDVLKVAEEQSWDGTVTLSVANQATAPTPDSGNVSQSYPYSLQVNDNYTEKILNITPDQLNIKSERHYTLAEIRSNMPDTGKKVSKISLEGKVLSLETRNYQVVAFEKIAPKNATIISDDYAYVNAFDAFYPLLPEAYSMETVGSTYQIKGNDIAKVIFKERFNEKTCVVSGNATIEEIINIPAQPAVAPVKGATTPPPAQQARLLITVKIKQNNPDQTSFSTELIGFCRLTNGLNPSVELDLSGSFNIVKPSFVQSEKRITSSATGILKIKSKITRNKD